MKMMYADTYKNKESAYAGGMENILENLIKKKKSADLSVSKTG